MLAFLKLIKRESLAFDDAIFFGDDDLADAPTGDVFFDVPSWWGEILPCSCSWLVLTEYVQVKNWWRCRELNPGAPDLHDPRLLV